MCEWPWQRGAPAAANLLVVENEEQGVGLKLLEDRGFVKNFERLGREARGKVWGRVLRLVLLDQGRIPCGFKQTETQQ